MKKLLCLARDWLSAFAIVVLVIGLLAFIMASIADAQDITYCQTPVRKEIDYNGWKVSRDDGYGRVGIYVTLANGRQVRFDPDARSAYLVEWIVNELPISPVADKKLISYKRAEYTQEIATTNGRPRITAVHRSWLEAKWHQSGGMEGITGYKSEIFGPKEKTEPYQTHLHVLNRFGYLQPEIGWARSYPNGTRFEDRLTNADTGKLFELRVAEKRDGKWIRRVVFKDEKQRPKGYAGLTVTCSSCHDLAGTGGYATGLVPGSDTILSDPVPALEQ